MTPLGYILIAHSSAYLLCRWWLALVVLTLAALYDQLFDETTSSLVWFYGYLPSVAVLLCSSVVVNSLNFKQFGIRAEAGSEFEPAGILLQWIAFLVCSLPAIATISIVSVAVSTFFHCLFMYFAYNLTQYSSRFSSDEVRRSFFFHWAPIMLLFVDLVWLIASIWLPDYNKFAAYTTYWWPIGVSMGSTLVYTLCVLVAGSRK